MRVADDAALDVPEGDDGRRSEAPAGAEADKPLADEPPWRNPDGNTGRGAAEGKENPDGSPASEELPEMPETPVRETLGRRISVCEIFSSALKTLDEKGALDVEAEAEVEEVTPNDEMANPGGTMR